MHEIYIILYMHCVHTHCIICILICCQHHDSRRLRSYDAGVVEKPRHGIDLLSLGLARSLAPVVKLLGHTVHVPAKKSEKA